MVTFRSGALGRALPLGAWEVSEQDSNDQPETGIGATTTGPEKAPEVDALAEAIAERDKLKDQLLRTAADFENFRRRARKDVEDVERRAKENVLGEVLSIIDNLERAVAAADSAVDVQAVASGVKLVLKSFEDVAQRIGLERITVVGERFDPNLHDAVQQVESAEHEPGTVMTEVLAGYRLGPKLLRPALVVVSKQAAN